MIVVHADTHIATYRWSIGDASLSFQTARFVYELVADGAELELIKHTFKNIPLCDGEYVYWTGDMAQFIYRNLFS